MLRVALFLTLLASVSCSGDVSDPTPTRTISGTWLQPFLVPGSSTVIQLSLQDTTIAGTGTFSIEAGRSGSITVTGIATLTHVDLDLARSDGIVGHFRGKLVTSDSMAGSLYYTGLPFANDPVLASFIRYVPLKL